MKYWISVTNDSHKHNCCVIIPPENVYDNNYRHDSRASPDCKTQNSANLILIRYFLRKSKVAVNFSNHKINDTI